MLFPKYHYASIKDSVMISGISRSGTTLLGKIIGSFKNFEYTFEPSIIFLLDGLFLNSGLDKNIIIDIFRTFFVEDKMLNFHLGRGYNIRPSDNSCIFNMKSYSEVMDRILKVQNTEDAIKLMISLNSRLAFKNPNVYAIIPVLLEKIPNFKVIDITRNLFDVLGSVVNKKWFNNKNLQDQKYYSNWPYHDIGVNMHVPYYVNIKKETLQFWNNTNEITRTAFVINELCNLRNIFYKFVKNNSYENQVLVLKYEDLLKHPKNKTKEVSRFINAKYTEMTYQKIREIENNLNKYDIKKLLNNCEEKVKKDLFKNNVLLGYKKS